MATTHYQPWGLMNQVASELNRFFAPERGARHTAARTPLAGDWVPPIDVREEEDRFVIWADLPGVAAQDIEIHMEAGVLTLSGERKLDQRETQDGYKRSERRGGKFLRRFTLPDTADADAITAQSNHGVLEIVIPKRADQQPRRIEVRS